MVLLVVLSELGECATKEEVNNEMSALVGSINSSFEKHASAGQIVICHVPLTIEKRLLTPTKKSFAGR